MFYWLWFLPWIIPVLLPLACVYLWREELSSKTVFFFVSFLSAFGVTFITSMLAGFLLEPLLRTLWQVPGFEVLGKHHPTAPYLVAAFNLVGNVGLLLAVMLALRRSLRAKNAAL